MVVFLLKCETSKYQNINLQLISKRTAAIERVKRYLSETIGDHKASFDKDNIRDFIDLYLKASREDSEQQLFTEANVYKIIVDLFLAGGETTGTSLDWALLYMVVHPRVQERCFEEISMVVGTGRPVCVADKNALPYTQATLLEIQRIANTLTFSLPHVANSDSTLFGYTIPKGSIVIANLYSAHQDPKYWPDPDSFRPERFLNSDGKVARKDGMVPFGNGPRLCIGEPLARMELFLIFTNLLQSFRFCPSPDTEYTLEGTQALTFTALPYDIVVKSR
ncbi:CP2U1-like protein [Mya arenaria]|uniref:CP2U1-like protein n=1 Tax=Mya arenaria TaxID=6604 RepID=A0ABY7DZY4_MYAAR|nr:CP2U1-like protein [Mya arenaria]